MGTSPQITLARLNNLFNFHFDDDFFFLLPVYCVQITTNVFE